MRACLDMTLHLLKPTRIVPPVAARAVIDPGLAPTNVPEVQYR